MKSILCLSDFTRTGLSSFYLNVGDNMQNVEAFYNELTPILEKIKESPEAFLEGTEVSKVTLWRWTNGINRKFPDPHKLLSVLIKISGKKNFKEVINHFGGEISKYLCDTLSGFLDETLSESSFEDNQNEVLGDFQSFLIFNLCETEAGSSRVDLINTLANLSIKKLGLSEKDVTLEFLKSYGEIVDKKIQLLITKGILELAEDGKFHTKKKELVYNSEISIKHFPEIIKGYSRPHESHLGFTTMWTYNQSIPIDLAKEIKNETKEFFRKIHQKMKNNKNKDGVPYQVIYWTDRLNFDNLYGSLEGDL
jgi:hypothetical protein